MDKEAWSKSPAHLVAAFEAVFPGPPAVGRQMFGYPAGFVNGYMFMGLHRDSMVLRLPDEHRAALLAVEGAHVFEPMAGRPMKGFVVVPPSLVAAPETLEPWVAKALAYAGSLPPKVAKAKSKAKSNSVRAKAKPTA
ncbi:MAG: hypothetical protein NVSMB32_04030 [Actinomycetota bacterium]